MQTIKAAVCHEFGKPLVIENVRLRSPEMGEVEVTLDAVAICHSYISYADGGWGDTAQSKSNISTTALCWAAFGCVPGVSEQFAETVARAEAWLTAKAGGVSPEQLAPAIIARYGKDRTFSVPILMMATLGGRLGDNAWRRVLPLPFELAVLPRTWFGAIGLPVVSYALPALIANPAAAARTLEAVAAGDLDRAVLELGVLDHAREGFHDLGDAGFVVGAQQGGAGSASEVGAAGGAPEAPEADFVATDGGKVEPLVRLDQIAGNAVAAGGIGHAQIEQGVVVARRGGGKTGCHQQVGDLGPFGGNGGGCIVRDQFDPCLCHCHCTPRWSAFPVKLRCAKVTNLGQ